MNNRQKISAPTRSRDSGKSIQRNLRAMLFPLLILPILAGCATSPIPTPSSTIPTQSGKAIARPLSCNEFKVVHFNGGKPDVTAKDVADALAQADNPIGHVRNVVGDNAATIVANQENNAAWHKLCDAK